LSLARPSSTYRRIAAVVLEPARDGRLRCDIAASAALFPPSLQPRRRPDATDDTLCRQRRAAPPPPPCRGR